MLKAHQFTVKGRDYATMPLPASEALAVLPEVIRLLGQELTQLWLMADEKGDRGIEALLENREVMGMAIFTIAANAKDEGGLLVVRDIMRHTVVTVVSEDGVTKAANVYDIFDEHFAGDPAGMMAVAAHALRASFSRP